jgi:hypothetical protein
MCILTSAHQSAPVSSCETFAVCRYSMQVNLSQRVARATHQHVISWEGLKRLETKAIEAAAVGAGVWMYTFDHLAELMTVGIHTFMILTSPVTWQLCIMCTTSYVSQGPGVPIGTTTFTQEAQTLMFKSRDLMKGAYCRAVYAGDASSCRRVLQ